MRHGTSNRRHRGNNNRNKGGNKRAQVYDSNGPDVRIRGTAHQICEKYTVLAKDALSSGDRVLAESYLQHAEHYQRIISTVDEQNHAHQAQKAQRHQQQKSKEVDGNSVNKKSNKKDDLSLPASILGDEVKVTSNDAVRVEEKLLEDA